MNTVREVQQSAYADLDEWFDENGLEIDSTGKIYVARKWTGAYMGRQITATCSIRKRTKHYGSEISRRVYDGHEFTVDFPINLHTRLTIVPQTAPSFGGVENMLLSRMGLFEIESEAPVFEELKIHVHDGEWSSRYLQEDETQSLVSELFPKGVASTSFSLKPGSLGFRMRISINELTSDLVSKILPVLCGLADKAEAMPAPTKVAKLTKFEKHLQDNPVKTVLLIIGGFLGVAVLFPLMLILLIALDLEKVWIFGVLAVVAWWFIKRKK